MVRAPEIIRAVAGRPSNFFVSSQVAQTEGKLTRGTDIAINYAERTRRDVIQTLGNTNILTIKTPNPVEFTLNQPILFSELTDNIKLTLSNVVKESDPNELRPAMGALFKNGADHKERSILDIRKDVVRTLTQIEGQISLTELNNRINPDYPEKGLLSKHLNPLAAFSMLGISKDSKTITINNTQHQFLIQYEKVFAAAEAYVKSQDLEPETQKNVKISSSSPTSATSSTVLDKALENTVGETSPQNLPARKDEQLIQAISNPENGFLDSLIEDSYRDPQLLARLQELVQTESIPFIMTEGGEFIAMGQEARTIVEKLPEGLAKNLEKSFSIEKVKEDDKQKRRGLIDGLRNSLEQEVLFLPSRFIPEAFRAGPDLGGERVIIVPQGLSRRLPSFENSDSQYYANNDSLSLVKTTVVAHAFSQGLKRAEDRLTARQYNRHL